MAGRQNPAENGGRKMKNEILFTITVGKNCMVMRTDSDEVAKMDKDFEFPAVSAVRTMERLTSVYGDNHKVVFQFEE